MRRSPTLNNKEVRPTASSSDALLSYAAPLETILSDLEGLDLEGLRRQWRNRLGGEATAHLPRWLLVKVLVYRLQVAAFGGLDRSVQRSIYGIGGEGAVGFDRRDPKTREGVELKSGALLVREWQGKLERVMVLEEGFAWNGKTYGSLSQIAKAMTGTQWNGHRFFGLRAGKGRNNHTEANREKRSDSPDLPSEEDGPHGASLRSSP
jgi:DUF2924 family protein